MHGQVCECVFDCVYVCFFFFGQSKNKRRLLLGWPDKDEFAGVKEIGGTI